ncbi:hypothetical protein C478_03407 [Natrinema thermotolerans DSM 11552]|nr:hypothetical protein C478_03407 [Natrinema thermotolerans DSM 11552]QCC58754.1 hypothetical protein DVR14_08995 [Natrinema thermotolerans]
MFGGARIGVVRKAVGMNRRALLSSAAVTSIGAFAGCLGARAQRSPSIGGGTVSLGPGEETTLYLSATTVGAIEFERVPATETVVFEIDAATLSPSPSDRTDSSPPCWRWAETRSNVDLEVPIRAAEDAEPGEYAYAVTAWADADRDDADSVTKEHTIAVTDSSSD